jgi:transposase
MIGLPSGARVWLACGVTDLRNGFDGLAGLVQTRLTEDAFSGQLNAVALSGHGRRAAPSI